ncbi:MAG: hypothetical protein QCI38_07810 [Candidatus Thermoplasmatota archaeon]|nr:hypothetical protein [Candidatus Thermoplasmatota archaeon]
MMFFGKEDMRSLLWSTIGSVISFFVVGFIQSLAFPDLSNLLPIIVSVLVFATYFSIAKQVRRQQMVNAPLHSAFVGREPDKILDSYDVSYFDVNWVADICQDLNFKTRYYEKPYAMVEGPYCPKCEYELDKFKKLSLFGWKDKYFWRCDPCGLLFERPDETLFKEKEIVKKYSMRDFLKEEDE